MYRPQTLQLDYARPPTVPRLAWLLLACGALATAIAGVEVAARWERVEALRVQTERLNATAAAAREQVRRAPRAGSENAGDRALRNDALRIERELDRPWWPLLDVLEANVADEVHPVQLSFDPEFRRATLQIEAKSLDRVFAYLHRLAAVEGVARASVVQHEWREVGGVRVLSARLMLEAGPSAPAAAARPATLAAAAQAGAMRAPERP